LEISDFHRLVFEQRRQQTRTEYCEVLTSQSVSQAAFPANATHAAHAKKWRIDASFSQ